MNETDQAQKDPFPDVRIDAKSALLAIVLLAIFYGGLFALVAIPERAIGWALPASLVLSTGLLLLSYIDMRSGLLLDFITLPLIASGLAYSGFVEARWPDAVFGAMVGYALVAGLAVLWRRLRDYEGVGLGDAKMLAAGGAWVGIGLLPMILLIASGLGIIFALIVSQKTRGDGYRVALPFGPFIGLGIWTCWCADGMFFVY